MYCLWQVALIVILAQIGTLVPASFYSSSCMDRVFTHFGMGDSVETNSSSFMVEMQVLMLLNPHPLPQQPLRRDGVGKRLINSHSMHIPSNPEPRAIIPDEAAMLPCCIFAVQSI